ncbi:MAG TPA: AbrB/MazE/SpoVT family DNA-binding domain-containing protein [Chloroflexota bacterium]|nr:AbrB/MazE/SpoVT family DNA-binding domain-containing protein [Chloroflexota bacterium]
MAALKTKLGEGGRVVIPAAYRRELGLEIGDPIFIRLEDGELRLTSRRAAIRRAQRILRQYIPEGRSLSDELIAERRREAALE